MNGDAIYGRPPVFSGCAVSSDLAAHLDDIDRAEKRAEHVDSLFDEALDAVVTRDLEGASECLIPIYDTCGTTDLKPMPELLRALDADNLDDWLRLMALAPAADREILALNMHEWLNKTMRACDWVQRQAERKAAKWADAQDAINAEDAALMRAGL